MDQWHLIVDVARCNNCAACVLANMDEHAGNDFPGYSAPQAHATPWIEIRRAVRGEGEHIDVAYMPTMCNHCANPPCAEGADGAVTQRSDGIVLIDPVKAKGRRDIVDRCPYGQVRWNEALQLPQAWTFDAHLLDAGWTQPRCQQACPTGALQAIKVSDERMREIAREQSLQVLRPELGAQPRVHYRNLHRMMSRFVAGTVLAPTPEGTNDCVEGCHVSLLRANVVLTQTVTDVFGDFRFDGLADACADLELLFEATDHPPLRVPVRTAQSGTSVGAVTLAPMAAPVAR